jgi:hypothetical protein
MGASDFGIDHPMRDFVFARQIAESGADDLSRGRHLRIRFQNLEILVGGHLFAVSA